MAKRSPATITFNFERPGHEYSHTNNWPAENLVDKAPTASVVVWSGLSLVALLAGTGALLAL